MLCLREPNVSKFVLKRDKQSVYKNMWDAMVKAGPIRILRGPKEAPWIPGPNKNGVSFFCLVLNTIYEIFGHLAKSEPSYPSTPPELSPKTPDSGTNQKNPR